MSKKRILVVDDTKHIRNILRFSLEKEGYSVVTAGNGIKALFIAKGPMPPDLIILDIMMPKMDGYRVISKLKENDTTSRIPVILLTAKAQGPDVIKGIEAGASDYVAKPFKFEALEEKIQKLLGHRGTANRTHAVSAQEADETAPTSLPAAFQRKDAPNADEIGK